MVEEGSVRQGNRYQPRLKVVQEHRRHAEAEAGVHEDGGDGDAEEAVVRGVRAAGQEEEHSRHHKVPEEEEVHRSHRHEEGAVR